MRSQNEGPRCHPLVSPRELGLVEGCEQIETVASQENGSLIRVKDSHTREMSESNAVVVELLSRTFETGRRRNRTTVEAVQQISFTVERGERLAFIGPNGAGKSTSIKMLTGILYPTSGTAMVLGHIPWAERRELVRRIGTLFGQRSLLWEELSPRAAYRMLAAIFGLDEQAEARRVGELGELLQAAELFDQPVRTLSLGQRMRCELAACMLHEPEILFLDEPTIGLDLVAKQRFREMLVTLNEERGTTVFLTSHDVADIEHVAGRAIVVNHGEIIYDDSVAAMRTSLLATKRIEVGLGSPDDAAGIESLVGPGVRLVNSSATVVRLDVDTSVRTIRDVVNEVLSAGEAADLSVIDPPLEHVIADIYESPP